MKGNNRGITLIALVVTIIVLLILASVSIRLLLGDNGILTKSSFAAFAEEMSSVEEQVIMARGAEQTDAIVNGTEDTIKISEDGIFVAKYNDEKITDKLKRDIVELRENNRNSGMSQEEINAKYEALKNGEGNIDGLLYINKKYAKGKDRTYLFDTKTSTVIKVPGKIIDGEEYHIYKWNAGSNLNITKPEGADLSEHRPLEDDWIPIYTIENYKKVATEEQNYDIYDLSGTKVGTYNMSKDAKYRMMNDIDFAEETVDPIKGFKGIFDGNGYYIKNIKVNNENTNKDTYYYYSTDNMLTSDTAATTRIAAPTGLFDRIESGRVENLGIDNADVVGNATFGKGTDWQGNEIDVVYASNVGILAGEIVGTTIENCIIQNSYATSKIDVTKIDSVSRTRDKGPVGALVGWVYDKETTTTIKNINVDNTEIVGSNITSGLVAVTTGNIEIANCLLENSTINTQYYYTDYNSDAQAGMLGHSYAAEHNISNCYVGNTIFTNNMEKYSSTTSAGIFGGMYSSYRNGSSVTQNINIADCIVENCEFALSANGAGICGNTGYSSNDHGNTLNITNCTVNNIKLNSATSGGILGYSVAKNVNIENCNVSKIETEENTYRETYSSNINRAGIVGSLYYPYNVSIKSCNVMDSMIVAYDEKDSFTITAGILATNCGWDMDEGLIKDCSVKNTIIKTKAKGNANTSGAFKASGIAGSSGGLDIDYCNIDDSYILVEAENQYTGSTSTGDLYYGNVSGIVGEDLLRSYDKKVTTISNCKISNTEITSNYGSAQGVQTYIYSNYSNDSNYSIINCDFQNSLIKGKRSTSGVCNYSSGKKLLIDSCDMINCNIISEELNASGIVNMGCYDNSVKNCNVVGCKIGNLNYTNLSSKVNVGGIISYTQTVNVENCKVKDTQLNNINNNTGGIIGCSWGSGNGIGNITGCTVENVNITAEKNNAAGIIGVSGGYNIKDCQVIGGTINIKSPYAGGIVGSAYTNNNSIENCTVKGLEIISKEGTIGGIIGACSYNGANISDCDVENVKITANGPVVGGVAGYYTGNIANCNVKSSIITTENYEVGGLVGNKDLEGNIESCKVESTQISGKDKAVGGLVGQHNGSGVINNSTVQSCKVSISGADAKGVGGIVGYGGNIIYSYTQYNREYTKETKNTITSCKVLGTEITGIDYVGGISGVASCNIQDCIVDQNSTITGTNYVGGIQGFGGILGDTTAMIYKKLQTNYPNEVTWTDISFTSTEWHNSNITGCEVKNTTINGKADINYIQGKNSYYVDGYTGTTGEDTITNCTYENTSLKSI